MSNVAMMANVVCFALVLVWFFLLKLLFDRLERDHFRKFEAMGRPGIFQGNNVSTGFSTLKFIFLREHRQLSDPNLSRFSDGLLVYLIFIFIVALGLVVISS